MTLDLNGKKIVGRVVLANILFPALFIQLSQSLIQVFNPAIEGDLRMRLALSVKPLIFALFLLAILILSLILFRILKPLLNYVTRGSDYDKARKATLSVPWVLILIHTSLWVLSNLAFYLGYHWKTPGGVPFFWSLSLSVLAGINGALFTSITMNTLLIPFKSLLKITSRKEGEIDQFNRNKNSILMISSTLTTVLFTAYTCRYYVMTPQSNGIPFPLGVAMVTVILTIVTLGFILISRREERIQMSLLTEKLKDLNRSGGDLNERLVIINFDNTGMIVEQINLLTEKLHQSFSNVARAAVDVMNISGEIDDSIERAMEIIKTILDSSQEVTNFLSDQKAVVNETGEKLSLMLGGFERISTLMEEHSRFVESTSSTIEEMTANIESVSENTVMAKEITDELGRTINSGSEAVTSSINSIQEINETAEKTNDLVKIVSRIAAQTNLLSMNAAIEAAHAGDKGRGFAVVADEVRKLASSSSSNTGEISENISLLNQKVEQGVETSRSAGEVLSRILEEINRSSLLSREIASAMTEQKNGTSELLKLVTKAVETSTTIQNETNNQVSKNSVLKENIQNFINHSARIQTLTNDQLEANRAIFSSLSGLKDLSEKGRKLGNNLETVISGFTL